MKTLSLVCVCLIGMFACTAAWAGDKEAKPEGKKPEAKVAKEDKAKAEKKPAKKPNPAAQVLKRLEKVNLTEDQKAEIEKIGAKFSDKLAEARKAAGFTKEEMQARKAAMEKAKADGLKGKELREAVEKAVPLTGDKAEAANKIKEVTASMNEAVMAVLTDEQKEALKPAKKDGDKKPAKKDGEKKKKPANE